MTMAFIMGMGGHHRTPTMHKQLALKAYRWRFVRALRDGDLPLMEDLMLDIIRVETEISFLQSRGLA